MARNAELQLCANQCFFNAPNWSSASASARRPFVIHTTDAMLRRERTKQNGPDGPAARKEQTMKKLLRIHQSSGMHWVGNGFPVRSVFDYNGLGRELSPFLLLDHAAPYPFPPGNERRGVGA